MTELLPPAMLPVDAVEFIRTRARGAWPATAFDQGVPDRETVVPVGWATQVAFVTVRAILRSTRFWGRLTLIFVLSALLAVVAGYWILLLAPALGVLVVISSYVSTRRLIGTVLPAGSMASTEFLEDRFISRNTGGVREIRFDEIRAVDVQGDVVLLRFTSGPGRFSIGRALIPENVLDHLHG